jgi:hypothetical protein
MSNPFLKPYDGNYLSFVNAQIEDLKVTDSVKVSCGEKDIISLRMSLKTLASKYNWQIKTKKDENDELWVKRIK